MVAEGKQILKHLQELVVEEHVEAYVVQPALRDLQQAAAHQRPS
jgi:hypothetical protein